MNEDWGVVKRKSGDVACLALTRMAYGHPPSPAGRRGLDLGYLDSRADRIPWYAGLGRSSVSRIRGSFGCIHMNGGTKSNQVVASLRPQTVKPMQDGFWMQAEA
jgi:hypothetical protein